MYTDITRQLSASAYLNRKFRDGIYQFAKNPRKAIIDSFGINTSEFLKHVLHARYLERSYYKKLFIPSIVFWLSLFAITFHFIPLILASVSFIIMFIIVFRRQGVESKFLKENLSQKSYNKNFTFKNSESSLIERYEQRKTGNLIVYSGYSPFVGSGTNIGGWSFALDIDNGKKILDKQLNPEEFELSELYNMIETEIQDLNIPNLVIGDKVFVNGKKIKGHKEFLPDPYGLPATNISDDLIDNLVNTDNKEARFYKAIQIADWEGDLVLSAYLRFYKSEKNLFVENNYYILPPINERFKVIDKQSRTKEDGFFERLVWSLLLTFRHSVLSIIKVLGYLGDKPASKTPKKSRMKSILKNYPDYDYGANTSIREIVSQDHYTQHFQKLDEERYVKIMEKRIFNSIGSFLDDKNIDTGEFKDRETSILNNGVIVTGGSVSGENIAVGKNTKIKTKK